MPHRPAAGPILLRILGPVDIRHVDGTVAHAILRHPKGVGVLAYLALAPERARNRDVLLALLWPDLDEQHARNALSQTLHRLRRALGDGVLVNRGEQDICLETDGLACDAIDFRDFVAAGRHADALAMYRGDLLEGFQIRGAAPELDEWLEAKRRELKETAIASAWLLSDAANAGGNPAGAAYWGRRALALAPADEPGLRRLVRLLDDSGDRTGALQAYEDFARALRDAFDLEPEAETAALIEQIRARIDEPLQVPAPAPVPALAPTPALAPAPAATRSRLKRARLPLALTAVALVMLFFTRGTILPDTKRVLAVGRIDSGARADSLVSLRFLLSTTLSRAPELSVVSDARMHELLTYVNSEGQSPAELRAAARAAGATEIIEGVVTQLSRGRLRLDLQRIDLASGAIRAAYTAEATQLPELVDLIGEKMTEDLGVSAPSVRLGATTTSLRAYALYEHGLRSFYQAEYRNAGKLFQEAVEEDSTFAMAAYYAGRSLGWPDSWKYVALARRLAENTSEHERLLIETEWAMQMQEHSRLTFARELAERFPMDPDGPLLYGRSLVWSGEFLAAVPHLWRAIRLDSLSLSGASPRCRACEAFTALRTAYYLADSLPAAERVAREWIRRQPRSPHAWANLQVVLESQGRLEDAREALRTASSYRSAGDNDFGRATGLWLRQGRFDLVDAVWEQALETGDLGARLDAYWGQTISFRTQGRLHEALTAARRFRQLSAENARAPNQHITEGLLEAVVRFEMGDARGAAALFDSISTDKSAPADARNARGRAWALTHAAAALAELRDTARLRLLEDTIRIVGARSAYARDQRLHHYVRGLRFRILGRNEEAAIAFRQAVFSIVEGHVRVNLELARTLMDLGRPTEAIPVLRSALSGPMSASGLYATRSDLQELLGYAFEAAQQPDSATYYFKQAAHAWQLADPSFRTRRADLLARIPNADRERAGR